MVVKLWRELKEADSLFPLLLLLQWLAMGLSADPFSSAEFPVNDDWAHVNAVRSSLEGGRIVIPDWTATNFIGLLGWGLLFAVPAGDASFAILRLSGFVAGLLGVGLCYRLCRNVKAPPVLAGVAAAALAANPLYLGLSCSFMGDVPFCTAAMASLWMFMRALQTGSRRFELAATGFALLAIMIRQTGMALPLAYGLALLLQHRFSRASFVRAMLVAVVCWAVQLGYHQWMAVGGLTPVMFGAQIEQVRESLRQPLPDLLALVLSNLAKVELYLALACTLPLLLIVPRLLRANTRRWVLAGLLLLGGAALFVLMQRLNLRMPLLGNDVGEYGLGMRIRGRPELSTLVWRGWTLLTLITALASAGLVLVIGHGLRAPALVPKASAVDARPILLLAFMAIYIAPILALPVVFDRYLLPLYGPALALLCWTHVRWVSAPPRAFEVWPLGVALGMASIFAAALLHDYYVWNRVRWDELDIMTRQEGLSARVIDGGFEFNASRNYTPAQRKAGPKGWFVDDDEYLLALADVDDYERLRERVLPTLLPFSPKVLLVLRRQADVRVEVARGRQP